MENIAYYNGKTAAVEELTLPINDRAVYFGDGVYDVAMIKNGKIFALGEHLARFRNSLRLLEIEFDKTDAELTDIFRSLLGKLDGFTDGILYWQASRGTAFRDHVYPEKGVPANLLITIKPKKFADTKEKLKLITLPDARYSMCNIKTINLIPNVMASQKAKAAGCDEAVFIRDGYVTECSHSNVSIIKNGRFITAPLDNHILPGVARAHILALCAEHGIPVEQRRYTAEELWEADEIIVSSTTKLCGAVNKLEGRPVGGRAADILETLQDAYIKKLSDECG